MKIGPLLPKLSKNKNGCFLNTVYKRVAVATWNEKVLRETQTLRAGCSKAEPKISASPQPPSRGRRMAEI